VGWSKHDALASTLLSALSLGRKWPRIALIQLVSRSPFDLRRLLAVPPLANPKGLALFARAWLHLHTLSGDTDAKREAGGLLERLLDGARRDFPGLSWGYPYPWQDLGFFAPAGLPNRIVTYFVGRALVHGYETLGDSRYLDGAASATEFLLEAPRHLVDTPSALCPSYVPAQDVDMAVLDVPALCGALCAAVGHHLGDRRLSEQAARLLRFVAERQTPAGAWFYADPPTASPVTHDNYHSGEIIEALGEYRRYSGSDELEATRAKGLDFYRRRLFTSDWRPKWRHDTVYPHDVHGYAQGILTFAHAGELELAGEVAAAALADLWLPVEERFAYQRHRLFTSRITLMRWCQAWMCRALAELLVTRRRAA
jgi:hypothetical protein